MEEIVRLNLQILMLLLLCLGEYLSFFPSKHLTFGLSVEREMLLFLLGMMTSCPQVTGDSWLIEPIYFLSGLMLLLRMGRVLSLLLPLWFWIWV